LWVDRLFDSSNLLHHLFIHSQTTGSIDDDNIIAIDFGLLDGFLCLDDRVGFSFASIYFGVDLFAEYTELLDSSRAIDIACNHHDFFIFLGLEIVC
jgi:hypothetical protein